MAFLCLEHISKHYGGVKALSDVSISINSGEIHAVVGENGAGKSTMMKIISGVICPTEGKITCSDHPITFSNTREAEDKGIFIIHQEPIFFSDLTVLENIFIGKEPKNSLGFVDWKLMKIQATESLRHMGIDPNILDVPMGQLSIGTQQMILIAKGVFRNSKLLILDEPTSILSYEESQRLFHVIKELAGKGVAILYISHRIPEILELANKVSVLKDGVLITTLPKSECSSDSLLEMMSGKKINREIEIHSKFENEVVFDIKNCSSSKAYQNISLQLKKGHILGLYGLIGAGRTELAQSIIGEREFKGQMFLRNKIFSAKNAKDAYAQKVVYLPEDRITQGTFSIEKIRFNMMAGLLQKLCGGLLCFNESKEKSLVGENVTKYSIKINDMEDPITSLSGGNQQKILFTRCLLHQPDILILDEPTRGIDVKTKVEIYRLIVELASKGTAILLISSELPEILALTQDVLVMHEGEATAHLIGSDCTEENVLRAALGS
ncbi:MAG: sugar ABC transporter ATP-binding protein [Brevinema sp.]